MSEYLAIVRRPDPRRDDSWCGEGAAHDHDACGALWNSADPAELAEAARWAIEQGKKREPDIAGSPGHEATLADWLSFRGLPAGSSLLTLIEHERANAALAGAFDAVAAGAPGRRSLTIGKRYFGNVRQLPSGRWQARYDAAGTTKKAPETFARREDAQAWLDDLAAKQKPVHPECPTCVCRPDPEQDETPST